MRRGDVLLEAIGNSDGALRVNGVGGRLQND